LGEDLTAPYEFSWNSVAAGNYSLTAKATDNQGAATSSQPVTLIVGGPNQAPSVVLTSPAPNTTLMAPASFLLRANASDSDGTISKVEFFRGTIKIGEVTSAPYELTWGNVAAGTYSLTAKAWDNAGATKTSASVSVKVNTNRAPTVAWTSPTAALTVVAPASLQLTANASDSDGTVTKVEFFAGTTKLGEDVSAPYAFDWANVPAGKYSLKFKATDNGGAVTTSASIAVTVAPAAPTALVATAGDRRAILAWSGVAGAKYYIKRALVAGGPYTYIISTTQTTYTNTGLSSGVRYFYVVTAVANSVQSAFSNEASVTP